MKGNPWKGKFREFQEKQIQTRHFQAFLSKALPGMAILGNSRKGNFSKAIRKRQYQAKQFQAITCNAITGTSVLGNLRHSNSTHGN